MPSKDIDQPRHLPGLIRDWCQREKNLGFLAFGKCTATEQMPMLTCVLAGLTCHLICFEMQWLNFHDIFLGME